MKADKAQRLTEAARIEQHKAHQLEQEAKKKKQFDDLARWRDANYAELRKQLDIAIEKAASAAKSSCRIEFKRTQGDDSPHVQNFVHEALQGDGFRNITYKPVKTPAVAAAAGKPAIAERTFVEIIVNW